MANSAEEFGAYLDRARRLSALSKRGLAELADVDESTVREYINGGRATPGTLAKIVAALDLDEEEVATVYRLAGLEMPRRRFRRSTPLTDGQLISMLERRLVELRAQSLQLPTVTMSETEVRNRASTITRLRTVADDARESGDQVAADAVGLVIEALDAQVVAATQALRAGQAQNPRPGAAGPHRQQ